MVTGWPAGHLNLAAGGPGWAQGKAPLRGDVGAAAVDR